MYVLLGINDNFELFSPSLIHVESQAEVSSIEQDLKQAKASRQEIEKKLRIIDEEKCALEKVRIFQIKTICLCNL